MRNLLVSVLFVSIAACGGKSKPTAAEPATPAEPSPATPPTNAEECEAAGYTVVGDIGDGQVKCPEGSEEISRIQYGIEGGVCCKALPATAEAP